MCTNPLHIKNRRLDFNSNLHKVIIDVPCGRCFECRQHQVNEMATRLSFESFATYKQGGHVLFLTFTFNDAHLPYACYHGEPFACFDSSIVKRFLKRLHRYYDKKGKEYRFKHFVCSEYGSQTKRPHLHGTFYLPACINHKEFARVARHYWTGIEGEEIGFMFPSQRDCELFDKHLVKSLGGCSAYASKYACKDLSFYKLPIVDRIMHDKEARPKYRDNMPRNYVSANVGISILPQLSLETEYLINPCNGKPCTIPKYALDKLNYRFYRDGRINSQGKPMISRELTDYGKEYMALQFRRAILNKAKLYDDVKERVGYQISSNSLDIAIWHYMYQYRTDRFFKAISNLKGFDPFNIDQVCSLHYYLDILRTDCSYVYFERVERAPKHLLDYNVMSYDVRSDKDMRISDYNLESGSSIDMSFYLIEDMCVLDEYIRQQQDYKAKKRLEDDEKARALKQLQKPH